MPAWSSDCTEKMAWTHAPITGHSVCRLAWDCTLSFPVTKRCQRRQWSQPSTYLP